MTDFISLHDVDRLKDAFELLPRPKQKFFAALRDITKAADDMQVSPVKFGPLERIFAKKANQRALYAAAWEWLRPTADKIRPDVESLRARLGLTDKYDRCSFCEALMREFEKLVTEYEELSRWIHASKAELEYELRAADYSNALKVHDLEVFQRSLLRALKDGEAGGAAHVVRATLVVAASTFAEVLAPKDNQRWRIGADANLMLPINASEFKRGYTQTPSAKRAEKLWEDVGGAAYQYFVVVADTRSQSAMTNTAGTYIGFWVPDVRPGNKPLPGAPSAWVFQKPNTVFVDDLPTLPIVDEVVQARWKEYMQKGTRNSFLGSVFTSIPVFARIQKETDPEPIAVVNVNIHTDRLLPRLLSTRWVNWAAQIVAPLFISTVHGTALFFSQKTDSGEIEYKQRSLRLPNVYQFDV